MADYKWWGNRPPRWIRRLLFSRLVYPLWGSFDLYLNARRKRRRAT